MQAFMMHSVCELHPMLRLPIFSGTFRLLVEPSQHLPRKYSSGDHPGTACVACLRTGLTDIQEAD